MQKIKVFKDSIYGYIEIEEDIVKEIIDSKYFQRLRRIEQTSMRCLYPSAHHDRFIHSIGTYYLGTLAVKALNQNTHEDINTIDEKNYFPDEKEQQCIEFSFQMACLLHDIGHSPFSHTLEGYYEKVYNSHAPNNPKHIKDILLECIFNHIIDDEKEYNSLKNDLNKVNPSPHEFVSSIIAIECFKDSLKTLAENRNTKMLYCFLVRCILGCLYTNKEKYTYRNCYIKLLNSTIDVDKMDYITRDSKVSGFENIQVDYKRIIDAIIFKTYVNENGTKELCLVFKKTAINVIQNVITSRNLLYRWIYGHHKVKYEGYLIENAIELIAKKKQPNCPNVYISNLFSVEEIKNNLICDDTIWDLFMKNQDILEVAEIIDRKSQKKAVWKSYAEYRAWFYTTESLSAIGDFSNKSMQQNLIKLENEDIKNKFSKYLNEFKINSEDKSYDFRWTTTKIKLSKIKSNDILIFINNKIYEFNQLLNNNDENKDEMEIFFYVYCSETDRKRLKDNNEEGLKKLIQYIKNFPYFKNVL